MDGPHLLHGSHRVTTDATVRRDLEASLQAAAFADIEARLCTVERDLARLLHLMHLLTDHLVHRVKEDV